MPRRKKITDQQIIQAYEKYKNITDTAQALGVSYPTAQRWLKQLNQSKSQGYHKPLHIVSGQQCRHIRECLGYTRDDISELTGISKTTLQVYELNKKTMRRSKMRMLVEFYQTKGIVIEEDGTWHVKNGLLRRSL